MQCTMAALTVESLALALAQQPLDVVRICGGGARNTWLMQRLTDRLRAWDSRVAQGGVREVAVLRLFTGQITPADWLLGVSSVRLTPFFQKQHRCRVDDPSATLHQQIRRHGGGPET